VAGCCEHGNGHLDYMKGGGFIAQLWDFSSPERIVLLSAFVLYHVEIVEVEPCLRTRKRICLKFVKSSGLTEPIRRNVKFYYKLQRSLYSKHQILQNIFEYL
jgi:hypothetical protein